jgi:hypothetical protein
MGRFRLRDQEGLRIKICSGLTWTARSLLPLSRSQPAGPEANVEPKKKPEGSAFSTQQLPAAPADFCTVNRQTICLFGDRAPID